MKKSGEAVVLAVLNVFLVLLVGFGVVVVAFFVVEEEVRLAGGVGIDRRLD